MLPCPDGAKVDIFSHNRKKSITFYYTKPKKVLKTGCGPHYFNSFLLRPINKKEHQIIPMLSSLEPLRYCPYSVQGLVIVAVATAIVIST